jgi:hypothetical protein
MSRGELEQHEYDRAYEDYRRTYDENQAIYDAYKKAYDEYRQVRDKQRKAERNAREAAKQAAEDLKLQLASEWKKIDNTSIRPSSQVMLDWYRRLPDNTSIENAGRTRAKYRDVHFEIVNAGTGPAIINIGGSVRINGRQFDDFVRAGYSNVTIFVRRQKDGFRLLGVNGAPFGRLQAGDHVLVDASRRVYVNGQARGRQPGSLGIDEMRTFFGRPR